MAKRRKRGRKAVGGLARFETAALVAERDRRLAELQERRGEALAALEEIDRALADLGGTAGPRPSRPGRTKAGRKKAGRRTKAGGGRQRGGASLADAIAGVLSSGDPKSGPDLIAAVRKAGYRSSSPNFRSMAQQRLLKDPRFKRVSRGVYALK